MRFGMSGVGTIRRGGSPSTWCNSSQGARIGNTAVSQCVRRVERQRRQDKHFDDELRRLEAALSVK